MAKKSVTKPKRSSDKPRKIFLAKEASKIFFDALSRPRKANANLKEGIRKYKEGKQGSAISPFTHELPVKRDDLLYYGEEVKTIANDLLDPTLIFISGYSGFGKTSFALDLQRELKIESDVTVVYSNIKHCRNEFQLISTYVKDVANALTVSIDWSKVDEEHFNRFDLAELPERLAAFAKRKVIIILDDFDCISGMKDQIATEGLLRSLWQNPKWVSMCVVMKYTYDTMSMRQRYSRPFYLTGMHKTLKDIPEQIWHGYLLQKFRDANRIVNKKVIEYMVRRMNNTPRSIQKLAHEIFISNAPDITIEIVSTAINRIVDDYRFGYNLLLKKITKLQLRVLLGYIDGRGIDIPQQFRTKTLTAIDEIVRNDFTSIPIFIDPFFQIYLEKRFSKSEALVIPDVK